MGGQERKDSGWPYLLGGAFFRCLFWLVWSGLVWRFCTSKVCPLSLEGQKQCGAEYLQRKVATGPYRVQSPVSGSWHTGTRSFSWSRKAASQNMQDLAWGKSERRDAQSKAPGQRSRGGTSKKLQKWREALHAEGKSRKT